MENKLIKIGLVSETFNKWERRIVITPQDMKELQKYNIEFIVQPSNSRIFSDQEFVENGIKVDNDLTDCSIILGVKQIQNDKILENKTYLFFSHTIKAQKENMPLLDKMLEKNVRFIDYEKITDNNDKRLVAFGKYAGIAGCIDVLSGVGEFLLNKGFSTPFLNISPSYFYQNKKKALENIKNIGDTISKNGLPKEFSPFIIGITSKGRCSDGVLKVLKNFKTFKLINPEEIENIYNTKKDDNKTIYVTVFDYQHYVKNMNDDEFNREFYKKNPDIYEPIFSKTYLPYLSLLYNCMYWDNRFPRIISKTEINLLAKNKNLRLLGIGDITADYQGSIEMNEIFTVIEKPFFIYDPINSKIIQEYKKEKNGVLYCSIDNLPSQFPEDATKLFSKKLKNFIVDISKSEFIGKELKDQNLPKPIEKAVIVCNGKLTNNFTYINKLRKLNEKSSRSLELNKSKTFESFETIYLKGHILDKLIFNKIMDLTTINENIYPKILYWDVGHGFDKDSAVTIKILYSIHDLYEETKKNIIDICKKENISIEFLKED